MEEEDAFFVINLKETHFDNNTDSHNFYGQGEVTS